MQDKERKALLRSQCLTARDSIPAVVRKAKDRMVCERLFPLQQFAAAKVVFSFASFRTEVDTTEIIKKCLIEGKRVVLPKVNRELHNLELYEIISMEELSAGYMGIPEPQVDYGTRWVDVNDVDVAIVPGAAYDLSGNRIGYGGGYYDRLLSGLSRSLPVIAIAYEEQITEDIPAEPHDIKVHFIVTDRRTIDCRDVPAEEGTAEL